MPANFELSETNASAIRTQYAVPPPADDRPAIFVLIGILTLAGVGMIAQDLRRGQIRLAERPTFSIICIPQQFLFSRHVSGIHWGPEVWPFSSAWFYW